MVDNEGRDVVPDEVGCVDSAMGVDSLAAPSSVAPGVPSDAAPPTSAVVPEYPFDPVSIPPTASDSVATPSIGAGNSGDVIAQFLREVVMSAHEASGNVAAKRDALANRLGG